MSDCSAAAQQQLIDRIRQGQKNLADDIRTLLKPLIEQTGAYFPETKVGTAVLPPGRCFIIETRKIMILGKIPESEGEVTILDGTGKLAKYMYTTGMQPPDYWYSSALPYFGIDPKTSDMLWIEYGEQILKSLCAIRSRHPEAFRPAHS